MSDYPHLRPATVQLLALSPAERRERCSVKHWYDYKLGREVLEDLRTLRDSRRQSRTLNRLILAPTNNGKTFLIERLMNDPQSKIADSGAVDQVPVIEMELPPVPRYGGVCADLLKILHGDWNQTDAADDRRREVVDALGAVGARMLIVDEVQNLMGVDKRERTRVLALFKYFSNELRINVVCAGNQNAATMFSADPSIHNRFHRLYLPPWKLDDDLRRWLAAFEGRLPLKHPSDLHDDDIARPLIAMSEGLVGAMSEVISNAAKIAIDSGEERITPAMLAEWRRWRDEKLGQDIDTRNWPKPRD